MGFGAWTSLQALTDLVSKTVPLLILNRCATAVDVASFHLGRMPDQHLRRLASAASLPAQPALTSIYATKGEGALDDLYYRGGRYHLWVTLCIVAPLLVFGREIVVLYAGSNYAPAAMVILGLLAVYPFLWASAMFYRVAHAIGRVSAYYVCDIVVQLVALGAIWYAVKIRGWGAPGAGLAIGVTGGLLHILLIWPMGLRLVRGKWSRFFRETFLPGVLPFAGAMLTCFVFAAFSPMNSWLTIGAGCAAAGVVYVALLGCFCLDAVDRDLVGRALRRFRRSPQPETADIALEKEST
jgi:O-antigen/teichoic acid export membrane protein